ncbi:hypothetical protein TanjilG_14944 [Lupinus angustifolius]|uniref:BEACH domain-containing protein n=1 Tax=Lupinus angustifolius TaxID=3871 RepID=A0A1J7HP40_LUPAN|nr:hypothetical protein TanjilG_14944 [Lupinus angustifolius]
MNIVKGVADLIRRTSSVHTGDSSGLQAQKFSPPGPKIRFSDVGDEAIVNTLWERYDKVDDKVEKKRLLHVFIKQFVVHYKDWEPVNSGILLESTSAENFPSDEDVVVGCSAGHPIEVIRVLIEEITQLSSLVTELNTSMMQSPTDLSGAATQLFITSEGFVILDALKIITRSLYNCRVFGYYGGIQKLTALMKGSNIDKKDELFCSPVGFISRADASLSSSNSSRVLSTEARFHWRQKATVSVMEAGGLNWLVELLRIIRRFSLKELLMDDSLQYLSLKILSLALSTNPRGQNHFKSIGGLEVLLDGLGFPSNYAKTYSKFVLADDGLSFGNTNNLQFLCENGRVHKFANSFCSPAFVLQDLGLEKDFSGQQAVGKHGLDIRKNDNSGKPDTASPSAGLSPSASFFHFWNDYVVMLSKGLCSFLLVPEGSKSIHVKASSGRHSLPVSSAYCELSIKWVMRVLFTIFPCIKACSSQNELPSYLRVYVTVLQNTVLNAFRNLLSSSSMTLEIFREEGIWDLIFSENFFYFESSSDEFTGLTLAYNEEKSEILSASGSTSNTAGVIEVNSLQMEVISFVELAATAKGNAHNTIIPYSEEDKRAMSQLCSKYLEMFTQIKEHERCFVDLSIDLMVGMRDMLQANQAYYQALFRDGECFLHVVSLLNSNLDEEKGEKLVLNVLQTLTCLLASNDASKAAFRALAGKGYQTLQSLLLDFCQRHSSERLLDALLDMLADGKFDIKLSPMIKSSELLQHRGLGLFQQLLKDSLSNKASCVRAGMLDFLLNWFSQEDNDSVIFQIAQLIQAIGGHSISGKDIRKIFALLRSDKVGTRRQYCSVLLTSLLSMLHEKGPTAFFDHDGTDSCCKFENEIGESEKALLTPTTRECVTAEVIELIASLLDENLANQQQMHIVCGFSVLGFLLQSVPPRQLNLESLSALKQLFNVVSNSGLAELLVKEAISSIFLNPLIWVATVYKVQRELYMFLIQQFDNDPRLLKSLCRLPRVLDIIHQFYCGNVKSRLFIGSNSLQHPVSKQVIGERPSKEEIHKIRLLLLSLGEMCLRQNIAAGDIKALIAFFETSQDMTCIEDVLHMVIRAVSQKSLLASFLEQVNITGGCQLFVNLLQRYLSGCEDATARIKIIRDLLDLLDSNPSNIEAFMEHGWNAWLSSSLNLDVLKDFNAKLPNQGHSEMDELLVVRNLFSLVLCHYLHSVKGGWQQLEETVNFLVMHSEKGANSCQSFLRDIYEDLIQNMVELSAADKIFVSQPCRDNTLYLLRLIDEMLISEIDRELPFFGSDSDFHLALEMECHKEYSFALKEVLTGEADEQTSRKSQNFKQPLRNDDTIEEKWWNLYDKLWAVISKMNGKGPSNMLPKSSSFAGPSLGQRARGLVESLNIPAAEVAAVVVSGGIGTALSGKPNKIVDKAMILRGERCPRIIYRLVILYLCKSSLERASRSQYGMLDDGARFHVLSHLIRETVNIGKSMLATSIVSRDDNTDSSYNSKDTGSIQNLIQKDRVLSAASDEAKYMKTSKTDRNQQIQELHSRIDENSLAEFGSKKAFQDEIQNGLNYVLASDDSRKAEFQLTYEEEQQNIAEKWIHMFRSLTDERGPWSTNPFPNCAVTHWKLDKTEDTWRRRPKLRRNYHFNEVLCNPLSASTSGAVTTVIESTPGFVGKIPDKMKQLMLKGIRKITDEGTLDVNESNTEISEPKAPNPPDHSGCISSDLTKESSDRKDIVQERKETSSSPETETSEFLVEGTGGSSVFRNFDASSNFDLTKSDQKQRPFKWSASDMDLQKGIAVSNIEVINGNDSVKLMRCVKRHRRWSMAKIKAVHWTRYLLRYTAIEIFFSDSVAPVFLNFASLKDAKDTGNLIVSIRNEYSYPKGSGKDKGGTINFVDRRVAQEMAENARESWRRRDMTNFEYLMILNTLAGRSYNDLTQYPVFPWVLADYSSEVLDYNKSSTFRDLSKAVGALNSKRFEVFEDRYRNFCDPDIPSFYYGSHYSSMGIVLYYLLRLEPFTSLHRNLQGGKFDHADRLFQSIDATYKNCLTNTSDVKELIPEFFYLPEFLVNSNSYHLGVKQDGEPIGDICLPPWAKGSPEEFIRRNREALESEYVSSNLHHWIDLVFGYKQRGKPAVEAANIFYYLTYEGAVDLETMEDDFQRAAIEDQIANFGQTPIQIFRKKHPRRGPPIPIAHPLHFAPDSISLTSIVSNTSNSSSAILCVDLMDSNVVLVNEGLNLSVKMWLTTQLQSGGNFTFSGSQDPFFGIGSDVLSPRKIGIPVPENVELGSKCFATMQTPSENFLISCGNWENSFQVMSLSDGRMVQSIRQHKDVVSCVAVTSDGSILATGSYDTTVMVWEVFRGKSTEKRIRNNQSELPRKNSVIVETPCHILCGHDDIITCLYVSHELDIIISGSKDGTCVFHTLREGRYVRSLRHPSGSPISKLVVSQRGHIVIYADDDLSLHLYSINGKHLASSESNGRLNAVQLSRCGEFLVGAGDHGQIIVRSMNTLEVVKKYNGVGKVITSLTVTPEECFLAGTKDGSLLVYSIENPQLRKTSHNKNMKSKLT